MVISTPLVVSGPFRSTVPESPAETLSEILSSSMHGFPGENEK
jgi:hypothetical protein